MDVLHDTMVLFALASNVLVSVARSGDVAAQRVLAMLTALAAWYQAQKVAYEYRSGTQLPPGSPILFDRYMSDNSSLPPDRLHLLLPSPVVNTGIGPFLQANTAGQPGSPALLEVLHIMLVVIYALAIIVLCQTVVSWSNIASHSYYQPPHSYYQPPHPATVSDFVLRCVVHGDSPYYYYPVQQVDYLQSPTLIWYNGDNLDVADEDESKPSLTTKPPSTPSLNTSSTPSLLTTSDAADTTYTTASDYADATTSDTVNEDTVARAADIKAVTQAADGRGAALEAEIKGPAQAVDVEAVTPFTPVPVTVSEDAVIAAAALVSTSATAPASTPTDNLTSTPTNTSTRTKAQKKAEKKRQRKQQRAAQGASQVTNDTYKATPTVEFVHTLVSAPFAEPVPAVESVPAVEPSQNTESIESARDTEVAHFSESPATFGTHSPIDTHAPMGDQAPVDVGHIDTDTEVAVARVGDAVAEAVDVKAGAVELAKDERAKGADADAHPTDVEAEADNAKLADADFNVAKPANRAELTDLDEPADPVKPAYNVETVEPTIAPSAPTISSPAATEVSEHSTSIPISRDTIPSASDTIPFRRTPVPVRTPTSEPATTTSTPTIPSPAATEVSENSSLIPISRDTTPSANASSARTHKPVGAPTLFRTPTSIQTPTPIRPPTPIQTPTPIRTPALTPSHAAVGLSEAFSANVEAPAEVAFEALTDVAPDVLTDVAPTVLMYVAPKAQTDVALEAQTDIGPDEHIDMAWPPGVRGAGCGLLNHSRTICYINSALQVLLHTPLLLRHVLKHDDKDCMRRLVDGFCMTCTLKQMACRLYADGTKAFTPAEIIGNMWRFTDLDASRQEDSHEFLSGVVQSFCAETMADDCDAGGRSFAQNLFEGRQLSRATCACGYYGDGRLESFHALSLPMEKDLNASLAAYTSHEELSDYRCERCDSCVKASRRLTIHDAPHILTLQLQRFAYTKRRELTKITKALEYPETLDLAPYMSEGRAGPVYRLCGIICHRSKRATDGHYVAWVKSSEGRWFEMNDEAVKEISEGQAFLSAKEDAYVLLYARVGDDERGEDAAEHAVEAVKREVETVEEVAEWSVVGGRKAKKAQKEVLRMQKRKMGETGNAKRNTKEEMKLKEKPRPKDQKRKKRGR